MQPTSKKSLSVAQVYVIQNELGLVKIGFANKPDKRIDSIAANSGLKIVNRHVSPPCFNFTDVEKQLHQHFSHARKHGEWFDLPFEIAVDALNAHFTTPAPSDNQALVSFNFQDHPVRTLQKNGDTWFCLKDVCDILEISNSSKVMERLTDGGVTLSDLTTNEGIRKTTFVNEPNLYRVIFRSDKPQAKAFQDWVFEEVLPSIRKTGGYGQCVLTPEFQSFIRATVANEVNAALQSKTKSTLNQQTPVKTLNSVDKWICECLDRGYFIETATGEWVNEIKSVDLFQSYLNYCDKAEIPHYDRKTQISLSKYLKTLFKYKNKLIGIERRRGFNLGTLNDVKNLFAKVAGGDL